MTSKTAGLQDNKYTTLADNITVKNDSYDLFVPTIFPDAGTQKSFNYSIERSFAISFDEWVTDRRVVVSGLENQVDIVSSRKRNVPKYASLANQTAARSEVIHGIKSVALFKTIDVIKSFCVIDGVRYREMMLVLTMMRTTIVINFETTSYFIENMLLKSF